MLNDQAIAYERPDYDRARHLLTIPRPTLIVLCGPSGCGKSTFANTHFPQTSTVSSDTCRSLISDDMRNMECSDEAFDLAYTIVNKRLKLRRTTIFDSTALNFEVRQKLREIAHAHNFMTLLLVLQTPFQTCLQRDSQRLWPAPVGKAVLTEQFGQFEETLRNVYQEGFEQIVVLDSNEVNRVQVRVELLGSQRDKKTGLPNLSPEAS